MTSINVSTLTNRTNLLELTQFVNTEVANGYFGWMLLISIFVISFIMLKNYEAHKAFAASGFVSAISAIILFQLQLVPMFAIQVFIAILVIGITALFWIESRK